MESTDCFWDIWGVSSAKAVGWKSCYTSKVTVWWFWPPTWVQSTSCEWWAQASHPRGRQPQPSKSFWKFWDGIFNKYHPFWGNLVPNFLVQSANPKLEPTDGIPLLPTMSPLSSAAPGSRQCSRVWASQGAGKPNCSYRIHHKIRWQIHL